VFVRLAVIVAVLVFCAPALAVTGGSLDGSAHPAVGILLADQGNGPEPACSGSLISPTVFLTAGHCTAGLASNRVWVSFDSQWTPSSALLQGTAYTHPLYGADKRDTHDVAVVVLDAPVTGIAPLALATENALATPPASEVIVGYGADQPAPGKKDLHFTYDFTRRYGTSTIDKVEKFEVKHSLKEGGACHGDSGGPELVGSTIVAITSWGDLACSKKSFGYRVDTPSARSFLGRFVTLP
jgi:trypsin